MVRDETAVLKVKCLTTAPSDLALITVSIACKSYPVADPGFLKRGGRGNGKEI